MISNVKLKKFLKASIFKPLTIINKAIPKDDKIILLHISNLGIRHNLKPIKDYLITNEMYKNYKIVCGIEKLNYADDDKEYIKYVTFGKSILTFFRAKHVFYTAGQIPIKPAKNQIVIQMDHGAAAFKTGGALSNINNGDEFFFTYITAPSELYVDILQREYLCKEKNVILCGEPMTDALFTESKHYNLGDFDKTILWMLTFRQSEYLNYDDSNENILPMFKTSEYKDLNEELKKRNMQIIVKLHTAQNLDELRNADMSNLTNLKIMSNDEFVKNGYEIYELLKDVDSLLGDYSSVSLHYLLLDKPLGFVIPDIDEYKERRGFVFENPEDYMAGHLIRTKKDFYKYLDDLSAGVDEYQEKRESVRNVIFKYQDGHDTERVLKMSNIELKR